MGVRDREMGRLQVEVKKERESERGGERISKDEGLGSKGRSFYLCARSIYCF